MGHFLKRSHRTLYRQARTKTDHDQIKRLRYEGSIQDYLSRLEDLNSRVGLTGSGLRDTVLEQMTPEMGRAIFHKLRSIPESDDALLEALREAGLIEEAFLRTQNRMKGSSQKNRLKTRKRRRTHWPASR